MYNGAANLRIAHNRTTSSHSSYFIHDNEPSRPNSLT